MSDPIISAPLVRRGEQGTKGDQGNNGTSGFPFRLRGVYDPSVTYIYGDAVIVPSVGYFACLATVVGVTPSSEATSVAPVGTHWALLVQKGDKGDRGDPGAGGGGGSLSITQTRMLLGDYPPAGTSPGNAAITGLANPAWTGLNTQKDQVLPYGAGTYVLRYRNYLNTTPDDNISGDAPSAPRNSTYLLTSTFDNAPPNPIYVTAKVQTATRTIQLTFDGQTRVRLDPAALAVDTDPITLTDSDFFTDVNGRQYVTEHVFEYVDNTLPAASDGNRYLVRFSNAATAATGSAGEVDKTALTISGSAKGFWSEDWRICNWPGSLGADNRNRIFGSVAIVGDSRNDEPNDPIQRFLKANNVPFTMAARAVFTETSWAPTTTTPGNPAQSFGRRPRIKGCQIAHHYYGVNDLTLNPSLFSMQNMMRTDWLDLLSGTRGCKRIVRETIYASTGANPLTGATAPTCYETLPDQVPDRTRYASEHVRLALNLWFKDPVYGPAAWLPGEYQVVDTEAYFSVADVAPLLQGSQAAGWSQVTVSAVGPTSLTLSDVTILPNPTQLTSGTPSIPKNYPYSTGWAVIINSTNYIYTALNAATKVLTVPNGTAGVNVGDLVSIPAYKYVPSSPAVTTDGLHPSSPTGSSLLSAAYQTAGYDSFYKV